MALRRPLPPESIFDDERKPFYPDQVLEAWIRATFVDGSGALVNPEHEHLQGATLGCLWSAKPNVKQMRQVIGQAEIPQVQGNVWAKARGEQQLVEWFGEKPDFVLTFCAHAALRLDDASWCALIEHELYHCAQARDDFGAPRFSKDGRPIFTMRGHDVEEFIGVVRRYGVDASGAATRELVDAANRAPEIARASIDGACGCCRAKFD